MNTKTKSEWSDIGPMPFDDTFGNRILLARTMQRKTIRDLAKCTGVSHALVYKWERGLCRPDDMKINKLAEYLQFPISFFMAGAIKWQGQ